MTEKKWKALDSCDDKGKAADVMQEADQFVSNKQQSFEWIIIKDSEGIDVQTTDTQVAISLQAAIQVAIAIVISITLGDTEKGKAVVQDLKQLFKNKQKNSQKTVIQGSKHIKVVTTDTQVAVNIQALLQILVTIVAKLDVL
ncbi:spore coat protein [Neobacillus sp. NPDC093182]|uniref:spore coat protein n=1 Tax=Neobacillus sp. NPDC093182 TaxID=3364297 RepID=UPI00382E42A2